MEELRTRGIDTLQKLANLELPVPFDPSKGAKETYDKLREQARVQYTSRENGYEPIYETLDLEEGKGLYKLPGPSENDVYLDFEGDRMIEPDGLEYMIGYVHKGEYHALWARNETEEKGMTAAKEKSRRRHLLKASLELKEWEIPYAAVRTSCREIFLLAIWSKNITWKILRPCLATFCLKE